MTAYRKLHRYNPQYAFTTWIYTIASRLAINHFRRKRVLESEHADGATETTPRSELIASEKAEGVWKPGKGAALREPVRRLVAFFMAKTETLPKPRT